MPGKKKKYNARFPPARIKKIMQSDEEVGRVAAAVPVIISRALELFVDSLLRKANDVATRRNARTLTPSHLKLCINSDSRFDFLKDLVSNVAGLQGDIDDAATATQIPATTASSTSDPMSQFHRVGGLHQSQLEDNKFLQFKSGEPQEFSQKRPSPFESEDPGRHRRHEGPIDLRCPNSAPAPKNNHNFSSSSKEGLTNIPSTSTGKKRGRPRKVASAETSLAPKPKRKSRDSAAGGYQYYSGSSFPSTKDPSSFENARNVGRVCDEGGDDLGVSGDEGHLHNGPARHYPNGTASGADREQQKPMQHFVLSKRNGSNGEDPAFVLLPQLGTPEGIRIGCDDEDSNALVVDEDYDC